MAIAPTPKFPERPGTIYDRKISGATPGQRGPLRFEEGIATDTDVPQEFTKGAMQVTHQHQVVLTATFQSTQKLQKRQCASAHTSVLLRG